MLNHSDIKLTDRDRQVVELLVNESMSNKEIAEQLNITARTVKQHLRHIFCRAGLTEAYGRKRVLLAAMLRPAQETKQTKAKLTEKQWLIAGLVADGLRNKEIAIRLECSEQGAKNYLRHIFDKAGVWSRLELAAWVEVHRDSQPVVEHVDIPATELNVMQAGA